MKVNISFEIDASAPEASYAVIREFGAVLAQLGLSDCKSAKNLPTVSVRPSVFSVEPVSENTDSAAETDNDTLAALRKFTGRGESTD